MRTHVKSWFRSLSDDGASAVEYGLLVAGIAVAIVVIVFTLGATVRDTLFVTACNDIAEAAGEPEC